MYIAYSDGACKGNGQVKEAMGGWGALVVCPDGKKVELCGGKLDTTNNQMELQGAIEALKATPVGATVSMTTDSQYVIKGITEWISGWKKRQWISSTGEAVKNQDYWKSLDILAASRTVTWHWVRGHTGHPENERCDELANEGISTLPGGPELLAAISAKPKHKYQAKPKSSAPVKTSSAQKPMDVHFNPAHLMHDVTQGVSMPTNGQAKTTTVATNTQSNEVTKATVKPPIDDSDMVFEL